MNKPAFYATVRTHLGKLKQPQVDGFEILFTAWNNALLTDIHWLGYVFATCWHETWRTMEPIKESGGITYLKTKPYYPYYGRGFIQLTWRQNYAKYGIAKTPDRALDPAFAAKIAIDGMVHGIFTGKKLADYFGKHVDPINARRIINGTDKAVEIASYYNVFVAALIAAKEPEIPRPS